MTVETQAKHRTGAVRSGDVDLFYRLFGAPGKTPVIVFHGANYYDSADWIGVGSALATDREVLAWDTRGFGRSGSSPSKDYSLDAHMGDVNALLDHFGWRKVVAMGHSMGGGRSIVFSARFPQRVEALVIVDHCPGKGGGVPGGEPRVGNKPTVFASIADAEKAMSRYPAGPAGSSSRARLEEILKPVDGGFVNPRDPDYMNGVPVGGALRPAKIVVDDTWKELASIGCPILLLRGTKSDRYDAAKLKRMDTEFPHVERVDIDSGHDVAGGASGALIESVRKFLDRL